MKLYLFDIDGTLIDSQGAGRRSLEAAFLALTGLPLRLKPTDLAGRTDSYIFNRALKNAGLDYGLYHRLKQAYIEIISDELKYSACPLLPGAEEAVRIVNEDSGSIAGLLTGNIRDGARLKLGSFFDEFKVGAFGEHTPVRSELVDEAILQYRQLFGSTPSEVILIGDTPHDIEAAKIHSAGAIAVTTGPYSRSELSDAGLIIDSLEELAEYLSAEDQ